MKNMTDREIRDIIMDYRTQYRIIDPKTIEVTYEDWVDIVACLKELLDLRHEKRCRIIQERKASKK